MVGEVFFLNSLTVYFLNYPCSLTYFQHVLCYSVYVAFFRHVSPSQTNRTSQQVMAQYTDIVSCQGIYKKKTRDGEHPVLWVTFEYTKSTRLVKRDKCLLLTVV